MGRMPIFHRNPLTIEPCDSWFYGGLIQISLGYTPVEGRLHTCYAPVRRSSAESKLSLLPLDLHVLGLPLAFILSQDQTLHRLILNIINNQKSINEVSKWLDLSILVQAHKCTQTYAVVSNFQWTSFYPLAPLHNLTFCHNAKRGCKYKTLFIILQSFEPNFYLALNKNVTYWLKDVYSEVRGRNSRPNQI